MDGSGFRDSSECVSVAFVKETVLIIAFAHFSQIDAGHEIEVIRKASARLETLFAQNQRAQSVQDYTQPPDLQFPFSDARLKLESSNLATSADDMTGTKTSALARDGMYTGPTTVAGSHLITVRTFVFEIIASCSQAVRFCRKKAKHPVGAPVVDQACLMRSQLNMTEICWRNFHHLRLWTA